MLQTPIPDHYNEPEPDLRSLERLAFSPEGLFLILSPSLSFSLSLNLFFLSFSSLSFSSYVYISRDGAVLDDQWNTETTDKKPQKT